LQLWRAYTRKSFVGLISYVLGVAATLVGVHLALVLCAARPLFFLTPRQATREQF
jgi:hypothetical protein